MNNKISVIVPIYNSESTLNYCLDSIINQTYKALEIILINDGSNDNSEKICKEYMNRDKRIKYIKKTNSGVADTRNKGIELSTGKYIMFVDSDDYIESDYIYELYNRMIKDNVDIVVSSMIIREKNKDVHISLNKELCNVRFDDIKEEVINSINFTSSCKTLFKKSTIKNMKFNKELKYGEDMLFAYNALKKGNISYIDKPGYVYIQNSNSAIHNYSYERIKKYLDDTIYVLDTILNDNKEMFTLINNKKLVKINLALLRLSINKNIKYIEYKKIIKEFIRLCEMKNANVHKITNESKINKIRLYLLANKHYYIYYRLNKTINFIKRK